MERIVVVTGFGPFGCHNINASWEAVRLLPELLEANKLGVVLVTEEIPVEYDIILEKLRSLWEQYRPMLMIHVGVSIKAKELTLEFCASKQGYVKPDVKGKVPKQKECCIGTDPKISTNLDVERLAADLNGKDIGVTCCLSEDAGLYLCEFTYYTSLCVSGQDSLFVHVPDVGNPYRPEETAKGLCEIIHLAVNQLGKGVIGGELIKCSKSE